MKKECRTCRHRNTGICCNEESRHYGKETMGIETCGKWQRIPLRPCPFCGGEAVVDRCGKRVKGKWARLPCIKCSQCGTKRMWNDLRMSGSYSSDIHVAAEAWNMRYEDEI